MALATTLVLVLLLFGPAALGQETPPIPETPAIPEAPFGLTWLASRQAVREAGADCNKSIATVFGDSCVVSYLPKSLPDLDYAVLSFGNDDQLIRITTVGGNFENDHDGSRLRARYDEIEQLLERKYKKEQSERHTDKQFDGNNFELGLRGKKNWMFTVFAGPDMKIELSAVFDTGRLRWRLIFDYLPGLGRLKEQQKRTEEEAL